MLLHVCYDRSTLRPISGINWTRNRCPRHIENQNNVVTADLSAQRVVPWMLHIVKFRVLYYMHSHLGTHSSFVWLKYALQCLTKNGGRLVPPVSVLKVDEPQVWAVREVATVQKFDIPDF